MKIQRTLAEDAETILKLQKHAYRSKAEIYNDYNIPPLMQILNEIEQEFMHHIFLKAIEETETIIGSVHVCLEKETAHIGRLMAKPEYENRGRGTILIGSLRNTLYRPNGTNCLQDT